MRGILVFLLAHLSFPLFQYLAVAFLLVFFHLAGFYQQSFFSLLLPNLRRPISRREARDRDRCRLKLQLQFARRAAGEQTTKYVDPMERSLVADVPDENKLWQLVEIVDPLHCLVVTMPYGKEPANKVITTFMSPALASPYLAFHPLNNNIITIVTENSIIHIYYLRVDEVIRPKFKCHQKHIPGFAFSVNLKVMVSSEADAQAQLRFWNMDTWDKTKLVRIQLQTGKAPTGDTQVQFYSDQILLLVLVKTQPALYDGAKTECIQQWMPRDVLPAPITCAAYSPNNQLYGALSDSNVGVFDTDSLKLRCRIAMSVYFVEASRNRFKVPQPGSNAGIGAVLVTAQEVEAHSEKGLLVGAVAESDATEDPSFPGERMSKMRDAVGVSLKSIFGDTRRKIFTVSETELNKTAAAADLQGS